MLTVRGGPRVARCCSAGASSCGFGCWLRQSCSHFETRYQIQYHEGWTSCLFGCSEAIWTSAYCLVGSRCHGSSAGASVEHSFVLAVSYQGSVSSAESMSERWYCFWCFLAGPSSAATATKSYLNYWAAPAEPAIAVASLPNDWLHKLRFVLQLGSWHCRLCSGLFWLLSFGSPHSVSQNSSYYQTYLSLRHLINYILYYCWSARYGPLCACWSSSSCLWHSAQAVALTYSGSNCFCSCCQQSALDASPGRSALVDHLIAGSCRISGICCRFCHVCSIYCGLFFFWIELCWTFAM